MKGSARAKRPFAQNCLFCEHACGGRLVADAITQNYEFCADGGTAGARKLRCCAVCDGGTAGARKLSCCAVCDGGTAGARKLRCCAVCDGGTAGARKLSCCAVCPLRARSRCPLFPVPLIFNEELRYQHFSTKDRLLSRLAQ